VSTRIVNPVREVGRATREVTEDGIVGVGSTVETAFRAFDAQYLAALRPSVARAALNAESAAFRKRASPSEHEAQLRLK
jgi:hypothetical protein